MTAFELAGQILILILLLGFSYVMSRYDLKTLAVPDWPYWAGCILVIIVRVIFYSGSVYLNLISALVLLAVYYGIRLITKNHLGMGDVYFGIFQGLCLAPRVLWICLAVETGIGAIAYFCVRHTKKIKGMKMPFIPFMSIGLVTAFLIEWFAF